MSAHATLQPAPSTVFDKKPATTPPTPTPPVEAAAPVTTGPKPGSKRDLDYAGAWADEVDGVPTGSRAHDDDDQIVTETSTRSTKYSNNKKKDKSILDADHTVTRENTTVIKDGDATQTSTAATAGKVNVKDLTGELSRSKSDEHVIGEGDGAMSSKNSRSTTIDAGKGGAGVKLAKETEVKAGDNSRGHSQEVALGFRDGKVAAELKRGRKSGNAKGGDESERTFGVDGANLQLGSSSKREHKRKEIVNGEEVERTRSDGKSTSFKMGADGVGANRTYTQQSENGTKRSVTGGGSVDADGNVALNGGYTMETKGGSSYKANAAIDSQGNASIGGGYTKKTPGGSTVSVSAKAGISVEASEPKEVNGRWEVTYKRTKTVGGGAGGSHKGFGATASASHDEYDVGTRSFKTKDEAEDFRKHAAEKVKRELPDPQTLAGAMSMEIGETLGHGSGTTGQLGASASFEGATLSVTGTKKSSDETKVRRVSTNIFEVTSSKGKMSGKDIGLSGLGMGLNHGDSDSSGEAMTVRFDLATPEGQAAFQLYCNMGIVMPTGGKIVSETESKGEETHDGVSVFGLLDDVHQRRSWESQTVDEEGKHEEYGGERSHRVSTGWIGHNIFGDVNTHESVSVLSRQEDDKASQYRIEAQYGGESGSKNRKGMANLVGDFDDDKQAKSKASGDWSLSADIDPAAMKRWMKELGYDRLSEDDQMRKLSELAKEHGGNLAWGFEYGGDTKLAWDLELKGDKNFPGEKGRLEMEEKTQKYAELMKISIGSPELIVSQLQGEVADLEKRKAAVADPKRYSDLPDKLRMQQIDLIDSQIAHLKAIRHTGLVEMTKNGVGEDQGTIGARLYDEKGYDELPPKERAMARLRDEIAMLDFQLGQLERDNMTARNALRWAEGRYTDEKLAKQAGSHNLNEKKDQQELGRMQDDRHRMQSLGPVDDLRTEFLLRQAQPDVAMAYGNSLKIKLEEEVKLAAEAAAHLHDAARIQAMVNDKKALQGKHAAFWADVADDIEVSGYQLAEKPADPFAREPVSMALD